MKPDFTVVREARAWDGNDPDVLKLLRSERLYKSLSLLLGLAAGLTVPASLLLLGESDDAIASFAHKWATPLMIRMDYRTRPPRKPIGGIPLYRLQTMKEVTKYLLGQMCLPLFQTFLDRFSDVFSVGVLLTRESNLAEVEVVGRGFDAADLRLGKAIPHETLQIDLVNGSSARLGRISDDAYRRARANRMNTIQQLQAYREFANRSGQLLSDLNSFSASPVSRAGVEIPTEYEEMSELLARDLARIAARVKSDVIDALPPSDTYVASLSFVEQRWVLWDVYGQWYTR